MRLPRLDTDPLAGDPSRWGHSLANLAELMLPCLDAAGARSVVEVGAYAGDLTEVLLDWAQGAGATVCAVDPSPQERLVKLAAERSGLELVRAASLEALQTIPMPDAAVIDGDHNYFTVSEELRLIGERAPGAELPLLLFHDVCWPHARRDDYFSVAEIPEDFRQPLVQSGGIFPGETGTRHGGLPYPGAAATEGGPRNGVLTAIEDFVASREGLQLAVVPAFFGFGAVWHREAPWGGAVEELLEPLDRNPLLERLEGSRVFHIANSHSHQVRAMELEARLTEQQILLRRLLNSSAFALAERLSNLRRRVGVATEQSAVSREAVRRSLGE